MGKLSQNISMTAQYGVGHSYLTVEKFEKIAKPRSDDIIIIHMDIDSYHLHSTYNRNDELECIIADAFRNALDYGIDRVGSYVSLLNMPCCKFKIVLRLHISDSKSDLMTLKFEDLAKLVLKLPNIYVDMIISISRLDTMPRGHSHTLLELDKLRNMTLWFIEKMTIDDIKTIPPILLVDAVQRGIDHITDDDKRALLSMLSI